MNLLGENFLSIEDKKIINGRGDMVFFHCDYDLIYD